MMTGREGHINKVKDTKIVALMFGGLGDFYIEDVVLNNKEDAAERLFPDR